MALKILRVSNSSILHYACRKAPVLFFDCANCANPHSLFPMPMEKLHDVYVISAESLYKFRDTVKQLPSIANELNVNRIIITSFNSLFNYDDEDEVRDIHEYCWEMIHDMSKDFDIGVENGPYSLEPKNCNRHHTSGAGRIQQGIKKRRLPCIK
jgi:hypothetical protein